MLLNTSGSIIFTIIKVFHIIHIVHRERLFIFQDEYISELKLINIALIMFTNVRIIDALNNDLYKKNSFI